ncbi:hypothetical protein ACU686_02845 [Yinghuangia aomiensis]
MPLTWAARRWLGYRGRNFGLLAWARLIGHAKDAANERDERIEIPRNPPTTPRTARPVGQRWRT